MSIQKEYEELALDGHNYLIWAMDMKICLHSCGLNGVLNEPEAGNPTMTDQMGYGTLSILRKFIHRDHKAEYLLEENPKTLWLALKAHYDRQRELIWPEANYKWNHLRL